MGKNVYHDLPVLEDSGGRENDAWNETFNLM